MHLSLSCTNPLISGITHSVHTLLCFDMDGLIWADFTHILPGYFINRGAHDCPSTSDATWMDMGKYIIWPQQGQMIHQKQNKTKAYLITYTATMCVLSMTLIWTDLTGSSLWLTHWGRVMHICISNITIIGSDDGLSPGRCQAIIWTNAGILLIWLLRTKLSEILILIHTLSFRKMHLKISSGKWRPFCLGLNALISLLLVFHCTNCCHNMKRQNDRAPRIT